jgi:predicted transcriptional regulator
MYDYEKFVTQQQIYDFVCENLWRQGSKSFVNIVINKVRQNVCMYRDTEGFKCAIGFLIPDDLYVENMERQSVQSLCQTLQHFLPTWITEDHRKFGKFLHENIDFLMRMQNELHDGLPYNTKNFHENFLQQAKDFAIYYGLKEFTPNV